MDQLSASTGLDPIVVQLVANTLHPFGPLSLLPATHQPFPVAGVSCGCAPRGVRDGVLMAP